MLIISETNHIVLNVPLNMSRFFLALMMKIFCTVSYEHYLFSQTQMTELLLLTL